MKRLYLCFFAVVACFGLTACSRAQDGLTGWPSGGPQAPAQATPIQVDTSQPGKVTVAAFSDSKVSLAAITYDFKDLSPRLSWALVYSKTMDANGAQFLGTAVKYIAYQRPGFAFAVGFGVKGLNLSGGGGVTNLNARQFVFGAGVTFKLGQ